MSGQGKKIFLNCSENEAGMYWLAKEEVLAPSG